MSDIIDGLKAMDTSTLAILGFAAVLLIFLLVLIIVTIKVLRSDYIDDEEETSKDEKVSVSEDDEEEYYDDDEDEDEDEDDETSRKIREAVESVEETKAKVEAEKIARELEAASQQEKDEARITAAARVEKIAKAVHEKNEDADEDEDDDYDYDDEDEEASEAPEMNMPEESEEASEDDEEEYSQDDGIEPNPDDADTNELDTDKIKAELRKERDAVKESKAELNEMAKQRAEAPEYNASFDSAFVDRPAYEEKVEPVIPNPTPESILGAVDASTIEEVPDPVPVVVTPNPQMLEEASAETAPAPAKKKKKKKKPKDRDIDKEVPKVERPAVPMSDSKVAKFFWYNQQDVDGLERKEDMYFKSHYFNEADEVILDLITEMYDCGFVRTEELQRIAYGITFKSLGMKEILRSEESLGFNKDNATKEPTEADKQEAYEKWCKYVDSFMEIIVINAPDEVREYILDHMYDYGHRDIEELMYSPY